MEYQVIRHKLGGRWQSCITRRRMTLLSIMERMLKVRSLRKVEEVIGMTGNKSCCASSSLVDILQQVMNPYVGG